MIGSHVVLALQSAVSRRIDPLKSAVLSITQFHAGSASNVIPDGAVLNGTVRTLDAAVRDEMQRIMGETAEAVAATYGATAVLEYERGYPSVVNAPEATGRAVQAAQRLLGQDKVITEAPPTMGGEDFSYMAEAVPAASCGSASGTATGVRSRCTTRATTSTTRSCPSAPASGRG